MMLSREIVFVNRVASYSYTRLILIWCIALCTFQCALFSAHLAVTLLSRWMLEEKSNTLIKKTVDYFNFPPNDAV